MKSKSITCLLLINFALLSLFPLIHANEGFWWNNDWSFKQEIVVPIETDLDVAKYQPIDVHVKFENPCWTKDEYEHSIRIIYEDEEYFEELDSQIYELEYAKENYISGCNIVFLIPERANGKERYFMYYDDKKKNPPNYVDHVSIEESYYFYEPVKGYPFESQYFKIIQDEYVVYAASKEGEFMGYATSQHITKLKEEVKEVIPKNGELIASFEFRYFFEPTLTGYSSTSQILVSDQIIIDGNLMVEFGIVSKSKVDDIQTTALYKYYYCPTDNKRIQAHVTHNINEDVVVAEEINTDGSYAKLQCGGVRSKSIQDLNFGEIPPFLHLYNERGIIDEYHLESDPENTPEDYDIRVLNVEDDVDLGSLPWVSYDHGDSGESHSIIFGSNQVVNSGKNEKDGLQLNSYEMDYPHFPGIETDRAVFEIGRNSYEVGETHDRLIPKGLEIEFDAEFFSSKNQGYEVINQEAEIFQYLLKNKPTWGKELSNKTEIKEGCKLSIVVHSAYSFPLGAAFSALTGKKFSYISAELHKDNEIICSGTPVRFKFNSEEKGTNNLKWLISTFFPIDWQNNSIFKEITFNDIESGRYLVKIYRENPFLKNTRQYIGFKIIDFQDDSKIHIVCKSEGKIQVSVEDINENSIPGCVIRLINDDIIVAENISDGTGQVLLTAPIFRKYSLEVLFNGFILFKENINLKRTNRNLPIKKNFEIRPYDFKLELIDTWGLPCSLSLNPVLTSNEMIEPSLIYADKKSKNNYYFSNLTLADYQLLLRYKSLSINEQIDISKQGELKFIFPVEYNIKLNTLDTRGNNLDDVKITISRDEKNITLLTNHPETIVFLPPGVYKVKLYDEDTIIGSRKINVLGERNFDFITNKSPLYPIISSIIILVLIIIAMVFCYIKNYLNDFLKIISVSFASLSIFTSWWVLHGNSSQVETYTNMFVFPIKIITITISGEMIGGEIANLPEIFVFANSFILIFSIIGCFLILSSIVIDSYNKKVVLLFLTTSLILFIMSISIFTYSMSQLTEVGIGSFIGTENLEIKIPGEDISNSILCEWGPAGGYYLYLLAIFLIILSIFADIRKKVLT